VARGGRGVETNRSEDSSDGIGPMAPKGRPMLSRGMSTRVGPGRTQSMVASGEPRRGIHRTTSDTVAKIASSTNVTSSKDAEDLAQRREDRLVQWQVDMFVRLLKRVVAARIQKKVSQDEPSIEQKSAVIENEEEGNEPHDIVVPLKESSLRFGSMQRDPSFSAPSRGLSFDKGLSNTLHSYATEISMDGVSILGQSFGELSFGQSFGSLNSGSDLGWSKAEMSMAISQGDKIVVDEVAEVIPLPKFKPEVTHAINNVDDVQLSEAVVSQLKDYIATIAHMYRKNPFVSQSHRPMI
jgi:hypothetical protein